MSPEYLRNPDSHLNVIYLDDDPVLAARQYCDRHVKKMIVETAQILATVWSLEPCAGSLYYCEWQIPMGQTPPGALKWLGATVCGNRVNSMRYLDHPCVSWARLYGGNYNWLYCLGIALLEEHEHRFDRIHASTPAIRALEVLPPGLVETRGQYCESPCVMPPEMVRGDAIESYRNFCLNSKTQILRYTRRAPPDWALSASFYLPKEEA